MPRQKYANFIVLLNQQFSRTCEIAKVDQPVLLTVPNPECSNVTEKFPHLKRVKMDHGDHKAGLPIHVILDASDSLRS